MSIWYKVPKINIKIDIKSGKPITLIENNAEKYEKLIDDILQKGDKKDIKILSHLNPFNILSGNLEYHLSTKYDRNIKDIEKISKSNSKFFVYYEIFSDFNLS